MADCPRCARQVDESDAFCRHCGAVLQGATVQETTVAASNEPSATLDDMAADFLSQLKDQPQDPNALYNLALTRYYARDWAGAAECLRDFVQLMPDFADGHSKLGLCLWHLGHREAALAAVRTARGLSPDDRQLADLEARMTAAPSA